MKARRGRDRAVVAEDMAITGDREKNFNLIFH
jgi:hypothetical protein